MVRYRRDCKNEKITYLLDESIMMIKIASAQYPVSYHSSLEDWKSHTEKWIKQAVAAVKAGGNIQVSKRIWQMEVRRLSIALRQLFDGIDTELRNA